MNHRTILITGASAGLGGALALDYAEPGRVLILHGRDPARLDAMARRCAARGAEVRVMALDLRRTEEFRHWLEDLGTELDIDLAILNAGQTHAAGPTGEPFEAIETLMQVNLMAVVAGVSALLPGMLRRGRGQIALVSSLAAYHGMPITPAYGASKAALKNYGEALRGVLAPRGIRINVILPGFVRTGMSDDFPGPKPGLLSAATAARIIRRGLEANRARIAFPRLLDWGLRCLGVLPAGLAGAIMLWLGYGPRGAGDPE